VILPDTAVKDECSDSVFGENMAPTRSGLALVRPYLATATPVRIEPHKASTQDIVLVVAKP
jgi:hypothetical protein